jgi:hypothetical protein
LIHHLLDRGGHRLFGRRCHHSSQILVQRIQNAIEAIQLTGQRLTLLAVAIRTRRRGHD